MPMGFGSQVEMKSVLESDNALVGSTRAAKIVQSYGGTVDIAKMMQTMTAGAGASSKNPQARAALESISGTMEVSGNYNFYMSVETGKVLKCEGNTTTISTVETPSQGIPSPMKMTTNMQMSMTIL